ncbi:MAG: hypothetical protein R2856_25270 [Caldilineaceae bacterium]
MTNPSHTSMTVMHWGWQRQHARPREMMVRIARPQHRRHQYGDVVGGDLRRPFRHRAAKPLYQ